MRRREDDDTRRMRLHLERQRTISSTTLRADRSISSWTNERQRRARACCSGSSRTISSPYRYTPMALNTHTHTHIIKYFISLKSRGCSLSVKVCSTRCSSVVCIYLVMNQKVFHISVSPGVRVFDHQLTPAMSDLEAKTQDHIHY